jgi:hypothetical protein
VIFGFFPEKFTDLRLLDQKIFLIFQHFTHGSGIFRLVRLCPQGMYCRSLGHIQHFRLNKSLINIFTHLSTQSIQFSDQMSLGRSSYIRVTRHQCNTVYTYCKNYCLQTQSGTGQSSFTSGMTSTYYTHIYLFL